MAQPLRPARPCKESCLTLAIASCHITRPGQLAAASARYSTLLAGRVPRRPSVYDSHSPNSFSTDIFNPVQFDMKEGGAKMEMEKDTKSSHRGHRWTMVSYSQRGLHHITDNWNRVTQEYDTKIKVMCI